jgi:hypothetical protein
LKNKQYHVHYRNSSKIPIENRRIDKFENPTHVYTTSHFYGLLQTLQYWFIYFILLHLLVYVFHIITFTGLFISYYYIYWFIYFILLHLLVYLFHIITFTGLYISYYYTLFKSNTAYRNKLIGVHSTWLFFHGIVSQMLANVSTFLVNIINNLYFTGLYISYYYIYWFIYFILLHLLVYIFQMMFQYTTSIIALVARQCGMFFNCSDSVVCFSTVSTVWYVAFHFIQYPLYLLIQKCIMKIDAHVQACERFGQLFYSIFKYFIQEQYCL